MTAEATIPDGRLFSPRQAYAAAFLGGPLAAAWLLSRNFATAGSSSRADRTLWIGFGLTILVLGIALNLPEKFPRYFLPLIYSIAIYSYASAEFGSMTADHYARGGRKGSWGVVVAVSVIGLLIAFGAAFAAVVVFDIQ